MKRYLVTAPAEEDLRDIWSYLFERAGPDRADRVIQELDKAMAKVAEMPGIGHQRDDFADQTLLVYTVYSYLIIYKPKREPLEIVRVIHGARDIRAMFEQS